MTETDTWTTGGSSVESTYDINGNAGDTRTVRLYRAADCYVGGSDIGYGSYDAPTQTVGCVRDKGDNTRTALPLSPRDPWLDRRRGRLQLRLEQRELGRTAVEHLHLWRQHRQRLRRLVGGDTQRHYAGDLEVALRLRDGLRLTPREYAMERRAE